MTTLQNYIQEQEKKFPFIPHADNFGSDGSVTGGSDIAEEVKSFHTASLTGLVDLIEKWAREEGGKVDIGIAAAAAFSSEAMEHLRSRRIVLKDLLTFLGRYTK